MSQIIPFPAPPSRPVWTLLKPTRVMECVIKAHLSGAEVRIHLGPALYYNGFDATPADAEARAATLKEALLADGWIER